MSEPKFVYVEQDPPLRGEERRKDRHRQYVSWRYHNDPQYRARVLAQRKEWYANDPEYRASIRAFRERYRARQIAVAREHGATP